VKCDESKFLAAAPGPPAAIAVVAVVVVTVAVVAAAAAVWCAFSALVLYLRDLIGEPIGFAPGDVDGEPSSSSISSACVVPGNALDFLAGVGRPVRFLLGDRRMASAGDGPPVVAIITLAAPAFSPRLLLLLLVAQACPSPSPDVTVLV
jgi:hypothetical protein